MSAVRLAIIRHASADVGPRDIARPLTDRGRRDAAAVGQWLHDHDLRPDLAVVSPATRAMQTWERAAAAFETDVRTVYDARVWANDVGELLAIFADQDESVATLAIVGHNPSVHELALLLAGGSGDGLGEFPTSTIAVFTAPMWSSYDEAELVNVVTCRS